MSEVYVEPRVERPPAPGEESAGLPLTPLVVELQQQRAMLQHLMRRAEVDASGRMVTVRGQNQPENGDEAWIRLYEVPQGYVGYLTLLHVYNGSTIQLYQVLADTGVAILGYDQGEITDVGIVLDTPGSVLATTQNVGNGSFVPQNSFPFTFAFGDYRCAPQLRGPGTFFVVVQSDNQLGDDIVYARGNVYLERFD